jgi:hypothetical protein
VHLHSLLALMACMLGLPQELTAHTPIVLTGDMILVDGEVIVIVSASAHALAQLANRDAPPRTIGDLQSMSEALRSRLMSMCVLTVDGKDLAPSWAGTLAEHEGERRLASEALGAHERLMLLWSLVKPPANPSVHMNLPNNEEAVVFFNLTTQQAFAEESSPAIPQSERQAKPPPSLSATLLQAVRLGYRHIIPRGLDHILFVCGLFFAARRLRPLLVQVTAFTAAHSITLGLAMCGLVGGGPVYAHSVEVIIAMSIAWIAWENIWLRREPGWRRVVLVSVFGLVHGLGFAGALGEAEWPERRFIPALLSAMLGIELGQLTVIAGLAALTAWWWRCGWYHKAVVVPASLAIGACGLWWTITRAFAN